MRINNRPEVSFFFSTELGFHFISEVRDIKDKKQT